MSTPIKLTKHAYFEAIVTGDIAQVTRAELEALSTDETRYFFVTDVIGNQLAVLDVNDSATPESGSVIVTAGGSRYKLTNLVKLISESPYAIFQ